MNPSEQIRRVFITREPIELYKILKFENLAASGGEAKALVAEGLVKVNGIVEKRKRKKILNGDIIDFAGQKMEIALKE